MIKKTIPLLLLAFLFCACLPQYSTPPALLAAASYYVATTGSDSNAGTQDKPWKTIQKAANSAPSGSVIYVQAGSYNERVSVKRNNLDFEAQGKVVTKGFTIYDSNAFTIHDVTVRGFVATGMSGEGFTLFGANITIENNEIYGNTGGDADGMDFFCHDCVIRNNSIHDLLASGHPDCFQTWTDSYHPAAYNVTFDGNRCDNMTWVSDGRGQGIIIQSGPGTTTAPPHDIYLTNNFFHAYKDIAISPVIDSPYNIYLTDNQFVGEKTRPNPSWAIQGIVCDKGSRTRYVFMSGNTFIDIEQPINDFGSCIAIAPAPTLTPTPTKTMTPTFTPTLKTATPSITPSKTQTQSMTPTFTSTSTEPPAPTKTPSAVPTICETAESLHFRFEGCTK